MIMINQINVGIIGTGWCGGIRANACADNPLVDKLYIAESNKERLQEIKKSIKIESSTDNWNELNDNKNIKIVALCDTQKKLLLKYGKKYKVKNFDLFF